MISLWSVCCCCQKDRLNKHTDSNSPRQCISLWSLLHCVKRTGLQTRCPTAPVHAGTTHYVTHYAAVQQPQCMQVLLTMSHTTPLSNSPSACRYYSLCHTLRRCPTAPVHAGTTHYVTHYAAVQQPQCMQVLLTMSHTTPLSNSPSACRYYSLCHTLRRLWQQLTQENVSESRSTE